MQEKSGSGYYRLIKIWLQPSDVPWLMASPIAIVRLLNIRMCPRRFTRIWQYLWIESITQDELANIGESDGDGLVTGKGYVERYCRHLMSLPLQLLFLTGFFSLSSAWTKSGICYHGVFCADSPWSQLLTGDKTESELRAWLLMRKTSWGSGLLRPASRSYMKSLRIDPMRIPQSITNGGF